MAERTLKSLAPSLILPAILAAVFLLGGFFFYPLEDMFQISVDEGFNLQRSSLYNQGYKLYQEINSDQPPLFTILLAAVLQLSLNSTVAARLLVLIFSAINVFSIGAIVSVTTKPWASIFVLPLFFILPWYTHLSTAIMIGLPAISLASFSVFFFILWLESNQWQPLALSAVLMALSVLVKLFTAFIAPLIFISIAFVIIRRSGFKLRPWRKWSPMFLWGSIAGILLVTLGIWLYGSQNLSQSLMAHFGEGTLESFQSEEFGLWAHLKKSWVFFLLGAVGAGTIFFERLWRTLILIIWLGLAFVVLSFYRPVWAHHQLLITVPLVGIQAVGLVSSTTRVTSYLRSKNPITWHKIAFPIFTLLLFAGMLAAYTPNQFKKFRSPEAIQWRIEPSNLTIKPEQKIVLDAMLAYAPETDWVVTDMPYYAFVAGLNVPPELATFSTKMIESGAIESYEVLRVIEKTSPQQVLIGRIQIKQVNKYLDQNYLLMVQTEEMKLYIRPDIIDSTQ